MYILRLSIVSNLQVTILITHRVPFSEEAPYERLGTWYMILIIDFGYKSLIIWPGHLTTCGVFFKNK